MAGREVIGQCQLANIDLKCHKNNQRSFLQLESYLTLLDLVCFEIHLGYLDPLFFNPTGCGVRILWELRGGALSARAWFMASRTNFLNFFVVNVKKF